MYFTKLISTVALILAAVTSEAVAQTVTYRGFSSTVQCSGTNFFCSDAGGVCCGPMPAGFAFSASFENLPAGGQGQGYTDACKSFLFSVFGPGTKCWNGGGARANFLNWFHSGGRRSIASRRSEACVAPDGFSYEDGEGITRVIKVAANQTEIVAEHYKNQDWKALAAYQSA